jgi:hypothetical protein
MVRVRVRVRVRVQRAEGYLCCVVSSCLVYSRLVLSWSGSVSGLGLEFGLGGLG